MKEVNPKETTRAYAFEKWMHALMVMLVCLMLTVVSCDKFEDMNQDTDIPDTEQPQEPSEPQEPGDPQGPDMPQGRMCSTILSHISARRSNLWD